MAQGVPTWEKERTTFKLSFEVHNGCYSVSTCTHKMLGVLKKKIGERSGRLKSE